MTDEQASAVESEYLNTLQDVKQAQAWFSDWVGEHHSAAALLDEANSRWRTFITAVPDDVGRYARLQRSYVDRPDARPLLDLSNLNPLIACTLWLFWEYSSLLQPERFLDIAEASAYLALASGVFDQVADDQADSAADAMILFGLLRARAFERLHALFSRNELFWEHLHRLDHVYVDAIAAERNLQSDPVAYDLPTFVDITGGKVAAMVVPIVGMAVDLDEPSLIEPLERSLRSAFVGGQFHDDVLDFEQDVAKGHWTRFLVVIAKHTRDSGWQECKPEEITVTNRRLWLDVEYLGEAVKWYRDAKDHVIDLEASTWRRYLENIEKIAESHRRWTLQRHVLSI